MGARASSPRWRIEALVPVADILGQVALGLLQLDLQALHVAAEPRLALGHFVLDPGRLVTRLGQRGLGLDGGRVVDVGLFHALEDLVGQHAVGHFVGRNLLLEQLVFAVAAGLVELEPQVLDLVLLGLQLQLLGVDDHAVGLGLGLGLLQELFLPRHVGLAGANLLGAAVQLFAQIGQLAVDAVERAENVGGNLRRGSHGGMMFLGLNGDAD